MAEPQVFGVAPDYKFVEMYLDSTNATASQQISDFSPTDWPLFHLNTTLGEVVGIKILEAELPFTFYVIDSQNNTTMMLRETVGGVTGNVMVTLPIGNYTGYELAENLEAALMAARTSTASYTVVYSENTGKFLITTNTPAASVGLVFGGDSTIVTKTSRGDSLAQAMGFNVGLNAFIGVNLQAPNASQLSGPHALCLCSTKLGGHVPAVLHRDRSANSFPLDAIIAKIPLNAMPTETVFWRDPDPQKYYEISGLSGQSLDLYLMNCTTGRTVRFNGVGFAVRIGLIVKKNMHVDIPSTGQQITDGVRKRLRIV